MVTYALTYKARRLFSDLFPLSFRRLPPSSIFTVGSHIGSLTIQKLFLFPDPHFRQFLKGKVRLATQHPILIISAKSWDPLSPSPPFTAFENNSFLTDF